MSIKIEPDHIPIAKFLAMERMILSLVEDNKKLKRYSADHGVQLKDLFMASANTVSKAEFLAAIAAQKYYSNRSEQNRIRDRSGGGESGPSHRERPAYRERQHQFERPDTGSGRPNTGSGRPNTGSARPNTSSERPNTGSISVKDDNLPSTAMSINEENDNKSLEYSRKQLHDKLDTRLVEKADSYYALGISNKEDKLGKEVAILEHVMRDLEADAEETYGKVEYLEQQLLESRHEVGELTTKLRRVEKNYSDLKKTIAADQQIILNRLDALQSDHSTQKEYVHSLHSNVEKNFKNVKSSIMRISSYNNDSIKEAMATAVKIAMGDTIDAEEMNIVESVVKMGTFGSRKKRRSGAFSAPLQEKQEENKEISALVEDLEVIEVRPVMKDALYPTLNLQKPDETNVAEDEEADSPDHADDESIRYVNDGNEMSGKFSFMDILKQKGVHLSPTFPKGPMYESVKNGSPDNHNHKLLDEDRKLLSESNKRLDKVEHLLPALNYRIDNAIDLVEKLHSAVRLLDTEHNGLLASHKELMRKTDRSEAVTLSILDQIIHACETCQAAVERQEGLSLEQARQFRIISDRLKKSGKGDNSNAIGNNGRLTFSNASYATPTMSVLPNIREWEALDKKDDDNIDHGTIMKQLNEYRKVYRSMVLEMNQLIMKNKEINTHTTNQTSTRQLNVVIPQAQVDETNVSNAVNNNDDMKNILQRSDISYNPTIIYIKEEMENMKTALTKMQKLQVKPVPKQTIDADVGSSPMSNKKQKIKVPRPPSVSKSEKLSRGSVDFNLDNDTAEESLMADVDPLREHIVDHSIPVRPSSKPSRVQKYFEKYKKSNGDNKTRSSSNNHDDDDDDYDDKIVIKNHHQFIKGDWPDPIEVSNNDKNNNNNNDNNNKDDITITSSSISSSIINNIWQKT